MQIAELELKEFLASDDSESDDSGNEVEDKSARKCKKRDKYRALIQSGDGSDEDDEDEDEEGQDMEVTFSTGLEDISKRILEKKNKNSETVWEAYLRKRREKKKASKKGSKYSSEDESSDTDEEPAEEADDFFVEEPPPKSNPVQGKKMNKSRMQESEASRAELELLAADENGEDTNLKGYNLKPKKSKGKKGKSIPDEEKIPTVDYDDPRFAPLYTSPNYALDPTDPQFKRYQPLICFIVLIYYMHHSFGDKTRVFCAFGATGVQLMLGRLHRKRRCLLRESNNDPSIFGQFQL